MVTPAISLHGVTKSYGSIQALAGVDLVVQPGEIFGFLGPNGAGKTTTIRILTGFIRVGGGSANVFGLDTWCDAVALKRRMGFLPDSAALYGGLTGREFLDYVGRLHGRRQPPLQRQLLDGLELSDSALQRKLKGYSQGMKQKVMLVQAIQHGPDLLILDEPTDAFDPLVRRAFFGLMRELNSHGATIFMSSHILPDVQELCDRVAIIRDGKLVSIGSVEALSKRYRRRMQVIFREPPPDSLSASGVEVVSKEGRSWGLSVSGDINPLLRELSGYDLDDLVFERTSLEEMFMGYYETEELAQHA